METPKIRIEDCNWNDISKHLAFHIAVLPWGSCEPHGEQLSYCTDTLLAEAIANEAILKSNNPNTFMMLPSIPYGSQNRGQINKRYCVHLSTETQRNILKDIVSALVDQHIAKLVIINGHNGNNFKSIVRDLELEFSDIDIYVCNYLDITNKEFMKTIEKSEEIDDHGGFTETSLMLHYYSQYVEMDNIDKDSDVYNKQKDNEGALWTPRNWDDYSYNTRIGNPRNANAEAGKLISEHIVDVLVKDFNKILKFKL